MPPRRWPEVGRCSTLQFSRRAFLKAGGALVVTLRACAPRAADAQTSRGAGKSVDPDDVGGFIAIDDQGAVTLYSGKVELGTGVLTARHADRRRRTVGTVRSGHDDPGRHAAHAESGADAMPACRSRTAACRSGARRRPRARPCSTRLRRKLGVAKAELVVRDGVVAPRDGSKFAVVRRTRRRPKLHDQGEPGAPLKDPKDYTIVGNAGAAARHSGQDLRHASTSCRT